MPSTARTLTRTDPESKRLQDLIEERFRLQTRLAEVEREMEAVRARRTEGTATRSASGDGRLAYRVSEVAIKVGVSVDTVEGAIRRRDLRAVKMTDSSYGATMILERDLSRWIESWQ